MPSGFHCDSILLVIVRLHFTGPRDPMRAARGLLLVVALFASARMAASSPGQVYEGTAQVVDGDTIIIDRQRLRLEGLDAPEKDQTCHKRDGRAWPCGDSSREALAERVRGARVRCVESSRDVYRRPLVHCLVAGQDLGSWLVSSGWAVAFVRYSDRYVKEEADARKAGRGVWAGTFDMPWEWRAARRSNGK